MSELVRISPPTRQLRSLVLASSSPRRKALIGELGLTVRLAPALVDEAIGNRERPVLAARRLARAKASAAATAGGDSVVIAGDTLVALGSRVFGKPADEAGAVEMLRSLRGRTHQVVTGVALIDESNGRHWCRSAITRVTLRDYSDVETMEYVAGGQPMDKAGAYGIQDDPFAPAAAIRGCYLNVVGLPLCLVARGLIALGYALPASPWSEGVCHCADDAPEDLRMKLRT